MPRSLAAIPASVDARTDDLSNTYADVRAGTQALAQPLSAEDCVVQSMPDASPVKWHLAHTTWFFETFVLEAHTPDFTPFDPAFRVLFNSYYNAVGEKHPRPERGMLTRPSLREVLAYRRHVDARVTELLDSKSARARAAAGLVTMGLNHEEQHQELILTDLKHLLSRNPLAPAYAEHGPSIARRPAEPSWVDVPGGIREIGADGSAFAFDNEGPRHRALLQDCQLASHPVSCREYLSFIDDGGYRRPELWLAMGWDAVQAQGWRAPMYWLQQQGRWMNFTLHGLTEIDPDAPVCHISYFEADAYARWAQARLPTEFEWEAASAGASTAGNFVESRALRPIAPSSGPEPTGFSQLFGDVWEWTQSGYGAYPGYRPLPGAVGEYNGKFMCNQYVLRGGSCATPRRHIRPTYRNFFPPEARWQFSGLRLARDQV
jgi:ergothioneine biosynthesis protein EgtB